MLQFDVVAHRLENEYGVQVIFESYNCATVRWIKGRRGRKCASFRNATGRMSRSMALTTPSIWRQATFYLNMMAEKYPKLKFLDAREVV